MRFLGIQIFLITALAFISGYPFPDFQGTNWDIVLFLTPSGIIHNFTHETVLKTFYSDISAGQLQISSTNLVFMAVIYVAMIVNVYFWMKRTRS